MRIVDRETLNVVYEGEYDLPLIFVALNATWEYAEKAIRISLNEGENFLEIMDFYDFDVGV